MKKVFQIKGLSLLFICLCLCLGHGLAQAANFYWVGGPSGNWSDPANWNPSGPPGSGDMAYLTQSDSTDRTVLYDYNYYPMMLDIFVVDSVGTGTMTFVHTTSSPSNLRAFDGWFGVEGTAKGVQSVGMVDFTLVLVFGINSGSLGEYTLKDGSLSAPIEFIGHSGTGWFTQEGGTYMVIGDLVQARKKVHRWQLDPYGYRGPLPGTPARQPGGVHPFRRHPQAG